MNVLAYQAIGVWKELETVKDYVYFLIKVVNIVPLTTNSAYVAAGLLATENYSNFTVPMKMYPSETQGGISILI